MDNFTTTQGDTADATIDSTSALSLEQLEGVAGGGFINNWKEASQFAAWPAVYTISYGYYKLRR